MNIHSVLFLTATEIPLFEQLPAAVRGGWVARQESLTYRDDGKQRKLRGFLLHLEHPSLRYLLRQARERMSSDAFLATLSAVDVRSISASDLAELLFVGGPETIGTFVTFLLSKADDPDDMLGIAYLTAARHAFLESAADVFSAA